MTRIRDDFWAHVDVKGPDECWPWLRAVNDEGYGSLWVGEVGRKTERAHRYAFKLTHGRWPEGVTRHTCDNPPCCNPAHLIEGTKKDNTRDAMERGRHSYLPGERHPSSRVTDRGVVVIKRMRAAGHTERSIGEYLGLSRQTVNWVLRSR